jgi:hypothetical protein
MNDPHGTPKGVSLRLAFVGADDVDIQYANQFVVQANDGELVIVVAQVAPPLLLGDGDEVLAQAKTLPFVPVKVLGRYGVSIEKTKQLRDLLDRQITLAESQREGG